MGGDSPPLVLFEAVLHAAQQLQSKSFFIVLATQVVIEDLRVRYAHALASEYGTQIQFYPVLDTISMSDEPLLAVRQKKESSIVMGIRLLKKRSVDAFVSAGNTGALIMSAAMQLPKLPGVKRVALLAVMPTLTGSVAVLDVGGNVSCKAHHLMQFAQMGAAYQSCCEGIETPAVGLLNIGVEARKGTSVVRQAYQALQVCCQEEGACQAEHPLNIKMKFVGNVEGRDVFRGGVDVLVTDGFTGNVLLKTSEGISSLIFDYIQEAFQKVSSEHVQHTLDELQRYFCSSEYPGAILCGVEGIVIKCHGNSSSQGMLSSINGAVNLIEKQFIAKIKTQLAGN